jgi:hypothetical protein
MAEEQSENGMSKVSESTNESEGRSYAAPRRSQRVRISMSVLVCGTEGGKAFEEKSKTITVSANGCLVLLAKSVTRGQPLKIVNAQTQEELSCKVTFHGEMREGKSEVAVEFAETAPKFWRIAFPPVDWDPNERKRAGAPAEKTPVRRP